MKNKNDKPDVYVMADQIIKILGEKGMCHDEVDDFLNIVRKRIKEQPIQICND